MKAALKRAANILTGDMSGLQGHVSGLRGNVSNLRGDVDDCDLTPEDRAEGVDVTALIGATDQ